jgi:hypothetical protein
MSNIILVAAFSLEVLRKSSIQSIRKVRPGINLKYMGYVPNTSKMHCMQNYEGSD